MKYNPLRITACTLAAAIVVSGMSLTAEASGISSALPSGGINISLAKGTTLETIQENTGSATIKIQSILDGEELEEARKAAELERAAREEEELKELVIAQVNDYVNVRNLPGEEGEIIGKLYNNSVGTFIGEENGWYQITSGTVTGYVKAEYCVTGEAAIELAKKVCTRIAIVDTETLKVRKDPSLEAAVLTLVPDKEELLVSEEVEGWVKVETGEGFGWVSTDYVILDREFVEAESKEEEAARLAREAEERRKAHAAAAKKRKANDDYSHKVTDGSGSELGQAVIDYALQFVGNKYVYGGTSLTNGTDCSGFVMRVYEHFGVGLSRTSASQRKEGYAVDGLENAQPGDIICYSGHVALYMGDGKIVHAANSRKGIIITNKADYTTILAIRRIF